MKNKYQQAKGEGVDESITECLYLPDLIEIVGKNGLYKLLGYGTREDYTENFERLRDFRNSIAHPAAR